MTCELSGLLLSPAMLMRHCHQPWSCVIVTSHGRALLSPATVMRHCYQPWSCVIVTSRGHASFHCPHCHQPWSCMMYVALLAAPPITSCKPGAARDVRYLDQADRVWRPGPACRMPRLQYCYLRHAANMSRWLSQPLQVQSLELLSGWLDLFQWQQPPPCFPGR